MKKKSLISLLLAVGALLAAAGAAVAERATVVRAGNMVLRFNGGVTPKKLPRKRLAPITLDASAKIRTVDGSHPPAAKTVTLDFDRHGAINARGLATCTAGKLQSRDTRSAKRACRKAIVGSGHTTVEVAFPEQAPFSASGPLVVFNGGVRHGVTKLYVHAYVSVPTPTALVTRVTVKKIHKGRFGTRALARIPVIAGGSGSVTGFQLSIHRNFRRHGRRQSYLLARCANGHLFAHARVDFRGGGRFGGGIARTCRPR
jgi:hypothetical protein